MVRRARQSYLRLSGEPEYRRRAKGLPMSARDFYDLMVDGKAVKYPRVTTLLNEVFAKEGLKWWAAWEERKAILAALEEVLTRPRPRDAQELWDEVTAILPKTRAFVKKTDEAADIGKQAHGLIQWHTRKMLGLDVEVEPAV